MTTYIGFMRGLNVGGKNKVNMADLRYYFAGFGYENSVTVGNTGIIIFNSKDSMDKQKLAENLSVLVGIKIQLAVYTLAELEELGDKLPSWWNQNTDWRHNVLFFLEEYEASKLLSIIEALDSEIERAVIINNTIFWSSAFKERKLYYRSEYKKLLKNEAYAFMTIRNANTFAKVLNKAKEVKE